jgi:hypothetical protein
VYIGHVQPLVCIHFKTGMLPILGQLKKLMLYTSKEVNNFLFTVDYRITFNYSDFKQYFGNCPFNFKFSGNINFYCVLHFCLSSLYLNNYSKTRLIKLPIWSLSKALIKARLVPYFMSFVFCFKHHPFILYLYLYKPFIGFFGAFCFIYY